MTKVCLLVKRASVLRSKRKEPRRTMSVPIDKMRSWSTTLLDVPGTWDKSASCTTVRTLT